MTNSNDKNYYLITSTRQSVSRKS